MGIGKAALQNTGHTFDLAIQLRTLEEAFPNLMVVGSRLWIELAFLLNGREKMKTPLRRDRKETKTTTKTNTIQI